VLSPREDPHALTLDLHVERLGLVLEPDGDPNQSGGVLNPAAVRAPGGELLVYPRDVAPGNISRVGIVRVAARDAGGFDAERLGYALQPEAPYELRPNPGYGCEDPRTTWIPELGYYVMAYTAFGPDGPRIAIATSKDAYTWERLGLMKFDGPGMTVGDDKDAAFFPEAVTSPSGKRCFAFYHRPMLHLSAVDGRAAIPMILHMPPQDRESIRIGYIDAEAALRDRTKLLDCTESVLVMSPEDSWGQIKIGGGTPPVRIDEGWLSLYHGVDVVDENASTPKFRYSAGLVVHDYERPDRIVYRSATPIFTPSEDREMVGVVDNVVFPTGIDVRADLGSRVFDVYYGMADYSIGAIRLRLG
jgi:predicted GH43/DUF377 family glycosyl hydrolase